MNDSRQRNKEVKQIEQAKKSHQHVKETLQAHKQL